MKWRKDLEMKSCSDMGLGLASGPVGGWEEKAGMQLREDGFEGGSTKANLHQLPTGNQSYCLSETKTKPEENKKCTPSTPQIFSLPQEAQEPAVNKDLVLFSLSHPTVLLRSSQTHALHCRVRPAPCVSSASAMRTSRRSALPAQLKNNRLHLECLPDST
ncbi:hypothetical protein KFK09_021597 [Dendrobium nobile]|uniref:Uncharacterized protein n=1 Tax=Dendrobium nobile TaxID=94219 RepID=A0A8T3AP08_DENNO|nr:hypothetical protein KFK09_021597 [Dendrobium nobile]